MKIMSINMRGWGRADKRRRLKQNISSGNFDVCFIQETKRSGLTRRMVASIWGRGDFEFVCKDSEGSSGGLLCVWVRGLFDVDSVVIGEHFLSILARFHDTTCNLVNVYSACNIEGKRRLWNDLRNLKEELGGENWCVVGDFNAVLNGRERRGISSSSSTEMREFKTFIEDMELIDLPALGKKFTFFANDGVTMSRLDRFLVSESFVSRWDISAQWVGDRDISDHCMLWLLSSRINWGPKPFRFNNCWLEHKDFANLVKEVWVSSMISGKQYYVLKEKLKLIKDALKKWNKEVFGIRDLQIENIVKDLNEVEKLAAEGGSPKAEQMRLLNADFWRELHIKESLLAQKSRINWLAEGDENSRFFHACIRSNRRRTQLVKLQVGEEWLEDVEEVKVAVKNHFEEFFKEDMFTRPKLDGIDFRQVDGEDNVQITRPFTVEEIREAVWECDGNKCPGPDGFNFNFFKSSWNLVEPEIVKFFEEFHAKGEIPKAVSASFLTLVPKVTNPQTLGEYRPISLIGSLYKMLAKVLAARLKAVVPKVISENQNAFIAGRNILDGVVVVNEVVDMAKRLKKKCLILKVDFQKVYDTVNWKYLDYMMGRMGFNSKWRMRMNACISSNSISVLVNGSPTGEFIAQRGIKQGDPLAPFLFLMAAEGLTGLAKKGEEVGDLKGFKEVRVVYGV